MNSCFLTGHREASEAIRSALFEAVEMHITKYGVSEFVVGNHGRFDRIAISVLRAAKVIYPDITLLLLVPYHPAERPVEAPEGFDSTFYPPDMEQAPRRFAISRANRYMIDHADYLVAYAWHPGSNVMKLVEYARKREKLGKIVVTQLCTTVQKQ